MPESASKWLSSSEIVQHLHRTARGQIRTSEEAKVTQQAPATSADTSKHENFWRDFDNVIVNAVILPLVSRRLILSLLKSTDNPQWWQEHVLPLLSAYSRGAVCCAGQRAAHFDTRLSGGVEGWAAARWGGGHLAQKQNKNKLKETKQKARETKRLNNKMCLSMRISMYQLCLLITSCVYHCTAASLPRFDNQSIQHQFNQCKL